MLDIQVYWKCLWGDRSWSGLASYREHHCACHVSSTTDCGYCLPFLCSVHHPYHDHPLYLLKQVCFLPSSLWSGWKDRQWSQLCRLPDCPEGYLAVCLFGVPRLRYHTLCSPCTDSPYQTCLYRSFSLEWEVFCPRVVRGFSCFLCYHL